METDTQSIEEQISYPWLVPEATTTQKEIAQEPSFKSMLRIPASVPVLIVSVKISKEIPRGVHKGIQGIGIP